MAKKLQIGAPIPQAPDAQQDNPITPKAPQPRPIAPTKQQAQQGETPNVNMQQVNVPRSAQDDPDSTPIAQQQTLDAPTKLELSNRVVICGQERQIKSTRLKYFRNHTANFYHAFSQFNIDVLLSAGQGELTTYDNDKRTGDKQILDYLIAIFDDPDFIHDHYNDIDIDTIERAHRIFMRINGFDQRQRQRQARAAAGQMRR